jgi:hypothetical protein
VILFAATFALSVFMLSGFSTVDSVNNKVAITFSIIIILFAIYLMYKIIRAKNIREIISAAIKLAVSALVVFLYIANFEEVWRFEASIRGIELIPRK